MVLLVRMRTKQKNSNDWNIKVIIIAFISFPINPLFYCSVGIRGTVVACWTADQQVK